MASLDIFNGPLAANAQASSFFLIVGKDITLDFDALIAGAPGATARIQWYPEYSDGLDANGNPGLAGGTARWFRELAEEDLGNGDVRMPPAIRRFSTQGADVDLPPGVFRGDAQFRRSHGFCRLQVWFSGTATVPGMRISVAKGGQALTP